MARNNFSTARSVELHRHTPQCRDLDEVSVGGSQATDLPSNMHLVCTILNGCRNLTAVHLREVRLSDRDQSHLLHVLSHRNIEDLSLVITGLSVQCTSAINQFLHERRHDLIWLGISENHLSDTFLLEVYHALSQCIALEQLHLYSSQLTSLSIFVLASLIRQLPRLSHLTLYDNDFRDDDENSDEFMQAVTLHDVWQQFYMPVPELIHPRTLGMLDIARDVVIPVEYKTPLSTEEWVAEQRHADDMEEDVGDAGDDEGSQRSSDEGGVQDDWTCSIFKQKNMIFHLCFGFCPMHNDSYLMIHLLFSTYINSCRICSMIYVFDKYGCFTSFSQHIPHSDFT